MYTSFKKDHTSFKKDLGEQVLVQWQTDVIYPVRYTLLQTVMSTCTENKNIHLHLQKVLCTLYYQF